jgi:hypothetical protein
MFCIGRVARVCRLASLALVVAAIGAPSANAFFSEADLARIGGHCLRDQQVAADEIATSDRQATGAGASEGLDWRDAGIGAGIGVAGGLCAGVAVVLVAQRRRDLAHA